MKLKFFFVVLALLIIMVVFVGRRISALKLGFGPPWRVFPGRAPARDTIGLRTMEAMRTKLDSMNRDSLEKVRPGLRDSVEKAYEYYKDH
jgi:hypothetical protein